MNSNKLREALEKLVKLSATLGAVAELGQTVFAIWAEKSGSKE